MKKVIVNADDFGLTTSVNKAILDVFKKGNLTSTTLMVNMPGTVEAVEMAHANPRLSVGLHFCITEGKPLSNCPTLLKENGTFLSRNELIKKILKRKVDPKDILNEFNFQLKKFEEFDLAPSHIDSHQHTMMIPFVFNALKERILSKELPIRIVNPKGVENNILLSRPKKYLKQLINRLSSNYIKKNFNNLHNSYLKSIHELNDPNNFSKQTYEDFQDDMGENDVLEIMIHPYILNDDVYDLYKENLEGKLPFLKKCEKEYQILISDNIFKKENLTSFNIFHAK